MPNFISCAFDNIWGVGTTPDAAMAEAAAHGGDDIESLDTFAATDRLADAIRNFRDGRPVYPTDIAWVLENDLADLAGTGAAGA